MSVLEDVFTGPNLLMGLGIAIAVPIVLPLVGAIVRPLTKATIRGGLVVADMAAPVVAGAATQIGYLVSQPWEQLTALVSEAKQEHDAAVAIQRQQEAMAAPEGEPIPAAP